MFVRALVGGVVILSGLFLLAIWCTKGTFVNLQRRSFGQGWPPTLASAGSIGWIWRDPFTASSSVSSGSTVVDCAWGALVSLRRGSSGQGRPLEVAGSPL
jgi:hypothetical protein